MGECRYWQGRNGKWYTRVPGADGEKKLAYRNTENEIKEYIKNEYDNPYISVLFKEYLERYETISRVQISTIQRKAVDFNKYFSVIAPYRIRSMTEWDWVDFIEGILANYELTAKRFCMIKGLAKDLLKYALRRGFIDFSPDLMLQKVEVGRKVFKTTMKRDIEDCYARDELRALTDYLCAHIDPYNLAILLMAYTGIRIGECVSLYKDDIYDSYITISKTECRYKAASGRYIYEIKDAPKTEAGIRNVFLPESESWILPAIKSFQKDRKFAFSDAMGNRINAQEVRLRLRRVCKKIGIPYKSPHKLRKTYATILIESGVSPKVIQSQLGHTDIRTTEQYYFRNRNKNAEMQGIINNIEL